MLLELHKVSLAYASQCLYETGKLARPLHRISDRQTEKPGVKFQGKLITAWPGNLCAACLILSFDHALWEMQGIIVIN